MSIQAQLHQAHLARKAKFFPSRPAISPEVSNWVRALRKTGKVPGRVPTSASDADRIEAEARKRAERRRRLRDHETRRREDAIEANERRERRLRQLEQTTSSGPKMREILGRVAADHDVDIMHIVGSGQFKRYIRARHDFCYRAVMSNIRADHVARFLDRKVETVRVAAKKHARINGLPAPAFRAWRPKRSCAHDL